MIDGDYKKYYGSYFMHPYMHPYNLPSHNKTTFKPLYELRDHRNDIAHLFNYTTSVIHNLKF